MKIRITTLLAISMLLNCFQSFAGSYTDKIRKISFYGGEWGNSWSGSILYRLETMPVGVNYFSVRSTDIAFQTFLSVLLSAKHANAAIVVSFDQSKTDGNGYVATMALTQE